MILIHQLPLLSFLMDLKLIAAIEKGEKSISQKDLDKLKSLYNTFFFDILGLQLETTSNENSEITNELMDLILAFRKAAKEQKDFGTADKIRDKLKDLDIVIKDGKEGADWSFEK